jgi:alanine racemase
MNPSGHNTRAWVEIDLPALDRNVGKIKQGLPKHIRYVAVVKADAYGHGMPEVVTRLLQAGVDTFAVANVAEASRLREISPDADILLLSPTLNSEIPRALELGLDITLNSIEEVDAVAGLAKALNCKARVHVKVDTGMGRSGVWHERAEEVFKKASSLPILDWCGVYTHFSDADTDTEYTLKQRNIFLKLVDKIPNELRKHLLIHADNSAGLESFSSNSPFNAVRIGLMQYGITTVKRDLFSQFKTRSVLSFHAKVVLVKDLPKGTSIRVQSNQDT